MALSTGSFDREGRGMPKEDLRIGVLAGIVCAAILAAFDCNFLIFESGGFSLQPGNAIIAFLLYGVFGVFCGGLLAFVVSLIRKTDSKSVYKRFRFLTFLILWVLLTTFFSYHLADFGIGHFKRGNTLHILLTIPVALLAAFCLTLLISLLTRLFGRGIGGLARTTVAVLVIALAGTMGARSMYMYSKAGDQQSMPPPLSPNILLFVMDTTRWDALSCNGRSDWTTPNLDRIASEGLLYSRAYSPGSWTPPAHASMFTGLYPSEHGTYSNQLFLKKEFRTISELLSEGGYETFFLSSKGVLRKSHGWDRGFHHSISVNVEDKVNLLYQRIANFFHEDLSPTVFTMNLALSWIEKRESDRPFFLFINVSDPHTKYSPREPFFSESIKELDLSKVDLNKVGRMVEDQDGLTAYNVGKIQLNETELEYVRCLYASEIDYQDGYVGRLFDLLRDVQADRKTVALITADHGEMLGEQNLMSHGSYLYNELTHVPLIIWGMGSGEMVENPVSLVDIFPTIANIAGLRSGPQPPNGRNDLLKTAPDRKVFSEVWTSKVMKKSVVESRYKYIWESTGVEYLFDLEEDPDELHDIAADRKDMVDQLFTVLSESFDLSLEGIEIDDVDESTRGILRSLGYVH